MTNNTKSENIFPVRVFPQSVITFITAFIEAYGLSLNFISFSCFMAIAASIGATFKLQYKSGYEQMAGFYAVLVGNAGTGKTAPLIAAFRPIEKRRAIKYAEYRAAMKKYRKYQELSKKEKEAAEPMEEPVLEGYLIMDYTLEALQRHLAACHRGLCVLVDELNGFFSNMSRYNSGSDSEAYNSLHSHTPFSVDRAGGEPLYIPGTALSIFGTFQTGLLKNLYGKGMDVSGFAARYLFVLNEQQEIPKQNLIPMDEKAIFEYENYINSLLNLRMDVDETGDHIPHTIRMSESATACYVDWYNTTFLNIANGETRQIMVEALMKLSQYVLRFSLVLHVAHHYADESKADLVGIESVEGGIQMFNFFYVELEKVFQLVHDEDLTLRMTEQQRQVYNALPHEFYIAASYNYIYEQHKFTKDQLKKFVRNKLYFTWVERGKYRRNYTRTND